MEGDEDMLLLGSSGVHMKRLISDDDTGDVTLMGFTPHLQRQSKETQRKQEKKALFSSKTSILLCLPQVYLLSIEYMHTYSRRLSAFNALLFSCGILHYRL